MIGDVILIKPHHLPPARELFNIISPLLANKQGRLAISIAGESGSGKSTLAMALKHVLKEQDVKSFIFHMDDYFFLPPTTNHNQRLDDINHVGPQEVNLALLDTHVSQVKKGLGELIKPLSHYKENEIRKEIIHFDTHKVIIVEGTYTSLLQHLDLRIFIDRNYKDTLEARKSRNRDPLTPFVEEVLEIEHQIIKKHKGMADYWVNNEYEITKNDFPQRF